MPQERSGSYPELPTLYTLHWYVVTLSPGALTKIGRDEYQHLDPDTGNTLVFHWVERKNVNFD